MLQETVTAFSGEGNSAIGASLEYSNFGRKQVADKACDDFVVLQTCR